MLPDPTSPTLPTVLSSAGLDLNKNMSIIKYILLDMDKSFFQTFFPQKESIPNDFLVTYGKSVHATEQDIV